MAKLEESEKDRIAFDNAIKALEAQLASAGAHLTIDSSARLAYSGEVKKMAEQLRRDAASGRITWASAAQQAQKTRNLVMEIIRGRSTPVGRAFAQKLKANGHSLNDLVAKQTVRTHGTGSVF